MSFCRSKPCENVQVLPSATHLKVSIRWELLYINRTPPSFINIDIDGSCDTFFFFSSSEIKDPPLRIKPYGKNLQNISWHAISYHSNGRKAGCASEESVPAHDYRSLHQNQNRQYEPCVPLSRSSLS